MSYWGLIILNYDVEGVVLIFFLKNYMKIFKIPNSGFCFGVKRSIDIAHRVINESSNNFPVYTYGPLIHNPQRWFLFPLFSSPQPGYE